MSKKLKILDTQNFLLNAEKITYKKTISQLELERTEEQEATKRVILKYEQTIRLLVKKVKQMKQTLSIFELERLEYSKEFSQLNNCLIQLKGELN